MESGNDDLEMSTSSSIYSFPTFSFKSNSSEVNSVFITYSKNDQVRLSIAKEGEDEYAIMFEGEFLKKEMKSLSEPDCLSLNIQSIHSFFSIRKYSFCNFAFKRNIKTMNSTFNLVKLYLNMVFS